MKLRNISGKIAAVGVAVLLTMTACDAVWTDSADDYGYYPGYYGIGIDNDWYPSLPGAPLLSPVYWGGQLYPGSALPPMLPPTRPGGPAYRPNLPSGNVRPGTTPSVPSVPSTPVPSVPSVPSTSVRPGTLPGIPPEQVTGGEPGIVMPPAGSGFKPTPPGRR